MTNTKKTKKASVKKTKKATAKTKKATAKKTKKVTAKKTKKAGVKKTKTATAKKTKTPAPKRSASTIAERGAATYAAGRARSEHIVVRGAKQHNLQDVTIALPRDQMIVITGPSGSGKSSLAFDTIYAEGQRRYVESLSAYARQFLDRLPRPVVESIDGLSPSICIQQRAPTRSPRSTVGTVTEVLDYLRLLYARLGVPHCPKCGNVIHGQTIQAMTDQLLALPEGTRFTVLAPIVRGRKGQFKRELTLLKKDGFARVRVDGEIRGLDEEITLDKNKKHDLEIVIDRLRVKESVKQRLTEALELATQRADGLVRIVIVREDGDEERLLSERFSCPDCHVSLPPLEPRLFSFNSPAGACTTCSGLGVVIKFLPELVVPDGSLSIRKGAIAAFGAVKGTWAKYSIKQLKKKMKTLDLKAPYESLSDAERHEIMYGRDGGYEGILVWLERRMVEYEKRRRESGASEARTFEYLEEALGQYAATVTCDSCDGARLSAAALSVTLGDVNLHEFCSMPLEEARNAIVSLELTDREAVIAERLVKEVRDRLGFMIDVGLSYLTLGRSSATLSGGEAQRIRLATQIGSGLMGVLYVLDEPSIGLHPRDNGRLIRTMHGLRDRGNTVIVVEHDEETIRASDHVVDMGPGAGERGGEVVSQGTPDEIANDPNSLTGQFLRGDRVIAIPKTRRAPQDHFTIENASANNLNDLTVSIPTGVFTCVTGVSGSGKSSLIMDTLLPLARTELSNARAKAVKGRVAGLEKFDKVVHVDQQPIGKTPRSNPATYTGVFSIVRELYAGLPEARARGYKPGRFSFNVKGGRCESCHGDGHTKIPMHFLPDVVVQCDVCKGRRFNRETLEVRYRGLDIADVLEMDIDGASAHFEAHPGISRRLTALRSVGLGYLSLGRAATTLSGGEAQRVKLAKELAKKATGSTLYILDEPTTGLHLSDVERVIDVLHQLVDAGNTVVVIEHHPDVMKVADHILDLGPEGGQGGGNVIAEGTPEAVSAMTASHTAPFLAAALS